MATCTFCNGRGFVETNDPKFGQFGGVKPCACRQEKKPEAAPEQLGPRGLDAKERAAGEKEE